METICNISHYHWIANLMQNLGFIRQYLKLCFYFNFRLTILTKNNNINIKIRNILTLTKCLAYYKLNSHVASYAGYKKAFN